MSTYVIVGASRGLGYQYLKALSKNSAHTIIGIVRSPETVQAKAKSDSLPSNVHILQGDLGDPASLNAAAQEVSKLTHGAVDYLIANGVYPASATGFLNPPDYVGKEQMLVDELNESMRINVAGVLFSVNAFIELVKKSSIKKVIAISTGMAAVDIVELSQVASAIPYALSKAALNILVAKFAVQWKNDGVIFLALSPGFVNTASDDPNYIPPEFAAAYEVLTEKFRGYDPDIKGPIGREESVDMQLQVIEKITIKESGQFLSHHGNKKWT